MSENNLPIPDDWDKVQDGYRTMQVTIPNSSGWVAMVKGQLLNLGDASKWDSETGDTILASETGFAIFESITFI